MKNINSISFPRARNIIVSGDIHGDFNLLVYLLCEEYQMKDTVLIVAGDCGFGFDEKVSYEQMAKNNTPIMNEANNWIVFVRGNHDNPHYFDGKEFNHERFVAVADYTILLACNHTILCVGGAISIDRYHRINAWGDYCLKHEIAPIRSDKFSKNYYWIDEFPIFDDEMLTIIKKQYDIDTVITHTAPDFCEFTNKKGLYSFAATDENLLIDVDCERATMSKLYNRLIHDAHPVSHWYYGHFHHSWNASIDGVFFRMLDIMEFASIDY